METLIIRTRKNAKVDFLNIPSCYKYKVAGFYYKYIIDALKFNSVKIWRQNK